MQEAPVRICVRHNNDEVNEEITIEILSSHQTFEADARAATLDEADMQGWDVNEVRYEIAPLDEQDDGYIIRLLEVTFPIENVEYDEDIDYDVVLTDAETTISDYFDNLLIRVFHDAEISDAETEAGIRVLPTLQKAIVAGRDLDGKETVDIVAYKIK